MIRVGKPQEQIIFFWRDWFRWLPPVCDRAAAVSSQWMKLQLQFKISRSDSHNLAIRLFPAKTSLFCCLPEWAKDEKFLPSTVLFRLYDHWVTRPKNFIETDTETFFRDQDFWDQDFFSRPNIFETETSFWDQMFSRPIPRLFFETNCFRDQYQDFF